MNRDIKDLIKIELGINTYSLNNNIASLRKKKALLDDKISSFLLINPTKEFFDFTFRFKIEEYGKSKTN